MKASAFLVAGLLVATPVVVPAVTPVSVYAASDQSTQNSNIEIPIETVKRGEAGSRSTLTTTSVANGEYTVSVTARNQSSVHPDSNLYVKSGDSVVKVADVEREANSEMTGDGTLVVENGTVEVELELGPDKVFSGGLTVVLELKPEPPVEEPETPVEETPAEEEPEVKAEATEKPAELPKTGPASLLAGVAGLGSVAYAGQMYRISRSRLHK